MSKIYDQGYLYYSYVKQYANILCAMLLVLNVKTLMQSNYCALLSAHYNVYQV